MMYNFNIKYNMSFKWVNSSFVKKVLIIFLIGLVCRVGLNVIYDLDMFKDFNGFIVLVSYGVMICSSIVMYELPGVNFNGFNLKLIKEAIVEWCNKDLSKDRMGVSGESSSDLNNDKIIDESNVKKYNLLHRKSSGDYKGKSSAAVTGLYGKSTTGRVSAGLSGLYGESSRESDRTDYVEDRYKDARSRGIRKISANNSTVYDRVSGFNRTVPVESREIYTNNVNVYNKEYGNQFSDHSVVRSLSSSSNSTMEQVNGIHLVSDERGGFKPVMFVMENGRVVSREMGEASQYGGVNQGVRGSVDSSVYEESVYPSKDCYTQRSSRHSSRHNNSRHTSSSVSERTLSSNERSYASSQREYEASLRFHSRSDVVDLGWNSFYSGTSVGGESSTSSVRNREAEFSRRRENIVNQVERSASKRSVSKTTKKSVWSW